jgi:diadenosine tetraphosphate (Ap4A) HIT family hydrolase
MKKISTKGQEIKRKIMQVYQLMAESREHKCTGCGQYYNVVPLSHSHIIPRSRRPDLVATYENITYHCLSMGENLGCHDIWEHGTTEEKKMMMDYEENMDYIRRADREYYNLLKLKE